MDAEKVGGIITAIIATIILLYPIWWILYPHPSSWYERMPPMAGVLIHFSFLMSNILGLIFVGVTKLLLKRSTVFGLLFISLGLLNLFFVIRVFPDLLLIAASLLTILVGVSSIVPLKEIVSSKEEPTRPRITVKVKKPLYSCELPVDRRFEFCGHDETGSHCLEFEQGRKCPNLVMSYE